MKVKSRFDRNGQMKDFKNKPTKKKLHIGIIFPDTKFSKELSALVDWCLDDPHIEVECLVTLPPRHHKKNIISLFQKVLWKMVIGFENFFAKDSSQNINILIKDFDARDKIKKIKFDSSGDQAKQNISELKEYDLDLLIAFELNKPSQILSQASRLGLLSFYHDEQNQQFKYPICFEEVLKKQNKTSFNILHVAPQTQKVMRILKGSFVTHSFFLTNQRNLFLRRNFYMQKILKDIYQGKNLNGKSLKLESQISKIATPRIMDQFRYIIHVSSIIKNRILNRIINKKDNWNVGINFSSWKDFDFINSIVFKNPDGHYLADPFILKEGAETYCFVEDYDWSKGKGSIAAYQISSGKPINLGIVLEESFHLSFPYIFKYESKIYMLPESSDNMDIRIYESVEFPTKWKLKTIIKENVSAADSMIFSRNGMWWLFSNINPIGGRDYCSELSIFYTDNPIDGEWMPHEKNPVIFDPSSSRNGGMVLDNDSLYRVGQTQTFGMYGGGGVSINQIVELTPSSYKEQSVLKLYPKFQQGIKGAHHLHSDGGITAFDFLI
tara:strand:- start:711 stop:2366 length:1656 start_codon:yes stop_codon:yes gene_type:complete